jgi:hypothetical protein
MKLPQEQTSLPDSRKVGHQNEAKRPRDSIHPGEITVVVLVTLNLCFLPWAFGGVDEWSQLVSAVLALVALVAALAPHAALGPLADRDAGRAPNWRRLIRFPVFWAGLVLFAYVVVQALNPAFVHHHEGPEWWLVRRDHVWWLPAGMSVPFAEASPWRTLVVWISPWATVCAIWTGLTGRRTVMSILLALEVNAFAFAAFGLVLRASGSLLIYGVRPAPSPEFFAALIYKNHAAAFFGVLSCIAIALLVDAIWQARGRTQRTGPAILHVLFSLTLALAVGLTFSVSGIVLLVLLAALVVPVTIGRFARTFRPDRGMAPALIATGTLLILIAGLGAAVGGARFQERLKVRIAAEGNQFYRPRWLAAQRGLAMFEDRWALGWGAGCFRYGFTKYDRDVPELTLIGGSRYRWEHVHNDWLELLIELGEIGVLPIAFMLAYWLRQVGRLRLWRNVEIFPILVGLGLLCIFAFVDFPFQNPAVLNTACALLPMIILWGEAETRRHSS